MGSILSSPAAPSNPTPVHPLKTLKFDAEGIAKKYSEERAKRIRDDGLSQFKPATGAFSRFKDDAVAPVVPRDPITADTTVVIVGGGFAGLVTAVQLKLRGVTDIRILDRAGGFGGTWYWNQYPGAACDLESDIYLPFLEETGYIPAERFPSASEILTHVERIAAKWDLTPQAHFHTGITSAAWDEPARRWQIRTDRSDHFTAQFVVLATGTFHEPKLPGIPGIETFEGHQFHSGRWNFDITGGDTKDYHSLTKLAGKTVGIIGTGASGVQLVPPLARSAKKLYVFQRTPSSVTPRENWRRDPAKAALSLKPGWQRSQMDHFANIMQGDDTSDNISTAAEGFDVFTMQAILKEARDAGVTAPIPPDQIPELIQLADLRLMERLRKIVQDTVLDGATAETLKPWFSFFCKRPAFNNEYLPAFNRPNVELVDTGGKGVSHLTKTGVVVPNGREYGVDLLVYATGFDFEIGAGFFRRTGIHLTGTSGQTPDEAWEQREPNPGPSTLFGIHSRGFPNLFTIGPAQAGVTANWTHTAYIAGEHIADVVAALVRDGTYEVVEPTAEAEEDWGKQVEAGAEMRLMFHKGCPPGYYNKEGKPEEIPARWAYYPKGIVAWGKLMKEWREEGGWKGMERR
ncbi:putative cyclohexanone monooxygenase [Podospora didyma]|uniref:Cyclohexanone monooxygenase n=1 Tax=Podospora didyma TaxID=330526 RepID=A0AAE0NP82_9PEZI|nr:putative cyclohexanone monooxygenase [Podospora didyma]